jgi:hypothetical protein
MSRRVRIERENCCDDLAVAVCGNPLQYARALTRLEELRSHAPAISVAANGGSLMDRIRRLVAERAESTASTSRWAAAIAMLSIVLIAVAVPSLPALADRDEKKKEQPAKKTEAKQPATTEVEVMEPAPEAEIAADEEDVSDEIPFIAGTPAPAPMPVPAIPATPRPMRAPRVMPATAPVIVPAIAPVAEVAALAAVDAWDRVMIDDESHGGTRDTKFGKNGKLSVEELIMLRNAGVTPSYIDKMRSVFPNITLGEIVGLGHMGVTTEYVANMRAAGVDIKTSSDAKRLAAMGVTPDFVKKLAAAGYSNLSVKELTRLAAAGVDEEFIREMSKYRDKN